MKHYADHTNQYIFPYENHIKYNRTTQITTIIPSQRKILTNQAYQKVQTLFPKAKLCQSLRMSQNYTQDSYILQKSKRLSKNQVLTSQKKCLQNIKVTNNMNFNLEKGQNYNIPIAIKRNQLNVLNSNFLSQQTTNQDQSHLFEKNIFQTPRQMFNSIHTNQFQFINQQKQKTISTLVLNLKNQSDQLSHIFKLNSQNFKKIMPKNQYQKEYSNYQTINNQSQTININIYQTPIKYKNKKNYIYEATQIVNKFLKNIYTFQTGFLSTQSNLHSPKSLFKRIEKRQQLITPKITKQSQNRSIIKQTQQIEQIKIVPEKPIICHNSKLNEYYSPQLIRHSTSPLHKLSRINLFKDKEQKQLQLGPTENKYIPKISFNHNKNMIQPKIQTLSQSSNRIFRSFSQQNFYSKSKPISKVNDTNYYNKEIKTNNDKKTIHFVSNHSNHLSSSFRPILNLSNSTNNKINMLKIRPTIICKPTIQSQMQKQRSYSLGSFIVQNHMPDQPKLNKLNKSKFVKTNQAMQNDYFPNHQGIKINQPSQYIKTSRFQNNNKFNQKQQFISFGVSTNSNDINRVNPINRINRVINPSIQYALRSYQLQPSISYDINPSISYKASSSVSYDYLPRNKNIKRFINQPVIRRYIKIKSPINNKYSSIVQAKRNEQFSRQYNMPKNIAFLKRREVPQSNYY